MMYEDATWEAFEDPGVLQGLEWRDALFWVPHETLEDEVVE